MPETDAFGDLHRDGEGNVVTLTWDQVYAVQAAFRVWQNVCAAHNPGQGDMANPANWMKSCLLGRMLTEGKLPLDTPPPTYDSAPWYGLVETGEAHFSSVFTMWIYHEQDGVELLLIHGHAWAVEAHLPEGGWGLTDPGAPGLWEMRPLRPDEEARVVGGSVASGEPEAILSDWVLKRVVDL